MAADLTAGAGADGSGGPVVAGWYPDPDGSGLMRWWDGRTWTSRMLRPWSPPRSPAERLALWLTSPAGSLSSALVATVTSVGWAATAGLFAVIAVTGRPVAGAASILEAAAFAVLPILDLAALIVARPRPGVARDARKAARRGSRAGTTRHSSARPLASRIVRGVMRRLDGSTQFTSLPRPVGRTLRAATLLTVVAFAWSIARGGPQLDGALGQQFVVTTLMMHLIGWCTAACRLLDRNRSTTRMWAEPLAGRGRPGAGISSQRDLD